MNADTAPRRTPRALVFRLGGRLLAAASDSAGRVVEIESCTRVPGAPSHLLGLANTQGTVLAVVDIRPLLGLPAEAWQWPLRAQVVGGESLRVAFAVEEILGFEAYRPDQSGSADAEIPDALRGFARACLRLPQGEAVLIDVNGIIAALRQRAN